MSNLEKYNKVFIETFGVTENQLAGLNYQDVEAWDSVGHMQIITELEQVFNIAIGTDDIIGFNSYEKGKEILSKEEYGIAF